jgi:hypothetical protein
MTIQEFAMIKDALEELKETIDRSFEKAVNNICHIKPTYE